MIGHGGVDHRERNVTQAPKALGGRKGVGQFAAILLCLEEQAANIGGVPGLARDLKCAEGGEALGVGGARDGSEGGEHQPGRAGIGGLGGITEVRPPAGRGANAVEPGHGVVVRGDPLGGQAHQGHGARVGVGAGEGCGVDGGTWDGGVGPVGHPRTGVALLVGQPGFTVGVIVVHRRQRQQRQALAEGAVIGWVAAAVEADVGRHCPPGGLEACDQVGPAGIGRILAKGDVGQGGQGQTAGVVPAVWGDDGVDVVVDRVEHLPGGRSFGAGCGKPDNALKRHAVVGLARVVSLDHPVGVDLGGEPAGRRRARVVRRRRSDRIDQAECQQHCCDGRHGGWTSSGAHSLVGDR